MTILSAFLMAAGVWGSPPGELSTRPERVLPEKPYAVEWHFQISSMSAAGNYFFGPGFSYRLGERHEAGLRVFSSAPPVKNFLANVFWRYRVPSSWFLLEPSWSMAVFSSGERLTTLGIAGGVGIPIGVQAQVGVLGGWDGMGPLTSWRMNSFIGYLF